MARRTGFEYCLARGSLDQATLEVKRKMFDGSLFASDPLVVRIKVNKPEVVKEDKKQPKTSS